MSVFLRFAIIIILPCFVNLKAQTSQTPILLADPTLFEEDGTYYLYGTKGDNSIAGAGFLVYTSTDLQHWSGPVGNADGYAFKKGAGFGTKAFWAPQIFKHQDTYYMAYTADEQIAIATATSPLGPFKNEGKALEAPVKQIDPFVFFDNGKAYLYHVRLQEGNRIFVAELTPDLKQIKEETLQECLHAETGWENTWDSDWSVSEGPTVFKHNNLYYLIYSANDFRNPDYAVGYATSASPLGPWTKFEGNPIISTALTAKPGIGHGDLVVLPDATLGYVLHTHNSADKVGPRKTGFVKLQIKDGELVLVSGSFNELGL